MKRAGRAARRVLEVIAGLLAVVLAILLAGALLASPSSGPSPAQLEREHARQTAVALQGYEEEARQAQYAQPGAPEPTGTFTP